MRRNHTGGRPGRLVIGLALGAALVLTAIADAQPQRGGGRGGGGGGGFGGRGGGGGIGGMGGMRTLFQPEFLRRDLQIIDDAVGLVDVQQFIFESLLEDYAAAFNDAADEMRLQFETLGPQGPDEETRQQLRQEAESRMQGLRDELARLREELAQEIDDPEELERQVRTVFEERMRDFREFTRQMRPQMPEGDALEDMIGQLRPHVDQWIQTRARLRNELFADFRHEMTEEQADRWPAVERKIVRMKAIERGTLDGESIDLIRVIEDLQLDPATLDAIADTLGNYEIAIDEALRARDNYLESSMIDLQIATLRRDVTTAQTMTDRQMMYRAAVRDLNETYTTALAELMAPDDAAALVGEVRARSYSNIYRPTRLHRMFDAVRRMEDLDADVLAAVENLATAYDSELLGANDRIMALTRQQEPEDARRTIADRIARMNGERPDRPENPVMDAYRERDAIAEPYIEQLRGLLSPEQFDELPQARGRGGRGQGQGQQGNGGGGRGGGNFTAEQRQQFMQRFDTDGDGELSETEREA
ncbi:MAG: hypothetical protein KDA25_13100, partial [Phycisphaerales bacterium]|nr:hypothetical protein [Phycisphaerales bacterium]